jgi:uncharacterized lipoprotein YddW (UPF0748 family)
MKKKISAIMALLVTTALSLISSPVLGYAQSSLAKGEKATWITRVDYDFLKSEEDVKQSTKSLKEKGFTTIYVNTFPSCTTYPSTFTVNDKTVLDLQCGQTVYKQRDFLAEFIKNSQGMRVCAWMEYGFMTAQNHPLLRVNKEVAMRTQSGSIEDSKEHAWLNPLHPQVQQLQQKMLTDLFKRYPSLNCIQYDDHMGINHQMGYDRYTADIFAKENKGKKPPLNTQEAFWLQWRASKITKAVENIVAHARRQRPNLTVSISPNPIRFSYTQYLQEIPLWVDKKIANELVFQLYRNDDKVLLKDLRDPNLKKLSKKVPTFIGLANIVNQNTLTSLQIAKQGAMVKNESYAGIALFHLRTALIPPKGETQATRDQMLSRL